MAMREMERQDWLLLLIKYAGSGGITPVQLQKIAFLFGKGMEKVVGTHFYPFVPDHYGPFAEEICSDAECLQACGLAHIGRLSGRTYETYSVTPTGLEQAKKLEKEIAPETRAYLLRLVILVQALSFEKVLGIIYRDFPEYKVDSVHHP